MGMGMYLFLFLLASNPQNLYLLAGVIVGPGIWQKRSNLFCAIAEQTAI